jgi:hypothetical protein
MPVAAFWRCLLALATGPLLSDISTPSLAVDLNHFEMERVLLLLKAIHDDDNDEIIRDKA